MRRGQLESGAPDKRLGKLRKVAAGNRKSTGPVSKKEELKDQHLLLHVCVCVCLPVHLHGCHAPRGQRQFGGVSSLLSPCEFGESNRVGSRQSSFTC